MRTPLPKLLSLWVQITSTARSRRHSRFVLFRLVHLFPISARSVSAFTMTLRAADGPTCRYQLSVTTPTACLSLRRPRTATTFQRSFAPHCPGNSRRSTSCSTWLSTLSARTMRLGGSGGLGSLRLHNCAQRPTGWSSSSHTKTPSRPISGWVVPVMSATGKSIASANPALQPTAPGLRLTAAYYPAAFSPLPAQPPHPLHLPLSFAASDVATRFPQTVS